MSNFTTWKLHNQGIPEWGNISRGEEPAIPRIPVALFSTMEWRTLLRQQKFLYPPDEHLTKEMLTALTQRLNCKPEVEDLSAYATAMEIFNHEDDWPLSSYYNRDLDKLKPFLLNGYQAHMLDRFIFSYDRLFIEQQFLYFRDMFYHHKGKHDAQGESIILFSETSPLWYFAFPPDWLDIAWLTDPVATDLIIIEDDEDDLHPDIFLLFQEEENNAA